MKRFLLSSDPESFFDFKQRKSSKEEVAFIVILLGFFALEFIFFYFALPLIARPVSSQTKIISQALFPSN